MNWQEISVCVGAILFLFGWLKTDILGTNKDIRELEKRLIALETKVEMMRKK